MSIGNIQAGHPNHSQPVAAPTPTQQIVDDANRIEYTTDALGRTLGFTRMNAKLRRRVLKAISAEQAEKNEYMLMAQVACACVSIDGAPVPFPSTELQVDALHDRLETEGLRAIGQGITLAFAPKNGEDLKNS